MKKIKILQFITPSGFYGAERWVLALANNLDEGKIICDLAVSDEGGNQDLSVTEHYPENIGEIHRIKMRGRFDVSAVKSLCHIIKSRDIDIIHTHGYKSDILGFFAARMSGIRCISTPHGFSGKVGLKLAAFIRMGIFMLRFFDAVVPLSDELMADMRRFKVSKANCRLISNGVDLKDIDSEIENLSSDQEKCEPTQREHIFSIGFVGQMIPRKGIPELLSVFDKLHKKYPHVRLKLVGDGHQREILEKMAGQMDSSQAIEFLGFRSDRIAWLKSFDLFVMTSSLEGIPRCMMEAMAVGTPVVGYDIPGVDALIEDGITGLLAPLGDRDKLQAICESVINDPESAGVRARKGRALIEESFSAARMAREYEVLYSELKLHGRLQQVPSVGSA